MTTNPNNVTINLTLEEVSLKEVFEKVEIEVYKFAIEQAKFNQSRAANMLGVSRGTLRKKLAQYFPVKYL